MVVPRLASSFALQLSGMLLCPGAHIIWTSGRSVASFKYLQISTIAVHRL